MTTTDTYEATTEKAREIGAGHGKAAASWYFDGNTNYQEYALVLEGIDIGDPRILDTFPTSPLSGEWADSYSPGDLASDLEVSQDSDAWDDYCTAYEDGFSTASYEEIERVARLHVDG